MLYLDTESSSLQTQGMAEVASDLWRSPDPNSLLKQCHLKQLPKTVSRCLLTIFNNRDSTTSQGNLCHCWLTLTVKKCFLMFRWTTLCFHLCSLPLVLSWGTTEKNLALFCLHPPFRYFQTSITASLSLHFFRLNFHLSQTFLKGEVLHSLYHTTGPVLSYL